MMYRMLVALLLLLQQQQVQAQQCMDPNELAASGSLVPLDNCRCDPSCATCVPPLGTNTEGNMIQLTERDCLTCPTSVNGVHSSAITIGRSFESMVTNIAPTGFCGAVCPLCADGNAPGNFGAILPMPEIDGIVTGFDDIGDGGFPDADYDYDFNNVVGMNEISNEISFTKPSSGKSCAHYYQNGFPVPLNDKACPALQVKGYQSCSCPSLPKSAKGYKPASGPCSLCFSDDSNLPSSDALPSFLNAGALLYPDSPDKTTCGDYYKSLPLLIPDGSNRICRLHQYEAHRNCGCPQAPPKITVASKDPETPYELHPKCPLCADGTQPIYPEHTVPPNIAPISWLLGRRVSCQEAAEELVPRIMDNPRGCASLQQEVALECGCPLLLMTAATSALIASSAPPPPTATTSVMIVSVVASITVGAVTAWM